MEIRAFSSFSDFVEKFVASKATAKTNVSTTFLYDVHNYIGLSFKYIHAFQSFSVIQPPPLLWHHWPLLQFSFLPFFLRKSIGCPLQVSFALPLMYKAHSLTYHQYYQPTV